MTEPSFLLQPPAERRPSIVALIVVAALVSAVAMVAGGTVADSTLALAGIGRAGTAPPAEVQALANGRAACPGCELRVRADRSRAAKPPCAAQRS